MSPGNYDAPPAKENTLLASFSKVIKKKKTHVPGHRAGNLNVTLVVGNAKVHQRGQHRASSMGEVHHPCRASTPKPSPGSGRDPGQTASPQYLSHEGSGGAEAAEGVRQHRNGH